METEYGDEIVESFFTKVVGVTFDNPDGENRQKVISRCKEGEILRLLRDSTISGHPNAVKVCRLNGEQLGYIRSELSLNLAPRMDRGMEVFAEIKDITGGEEGRETLGVNIEVFSRGTLIRTEEDEERVNRRLERRRAQRAERQRQNREISESVQSLGSCAGWLLVIGLIVALLLGLFFIGC